MPLVTLLTDFGLEDNYVAQMKGVILQHSPDCQIVDISHQVQRHNIVQGAFLLETAVPYFSVRAIHVAVVDPGVGSPRLPIIVKCKSAFLVGPDNGLLELASRRLRFEAAYKIDGAQLEIEKASPTFHGRDIFAKTAALLAKGRSLNSLGSALSSIVSLSLPKPSVSGKKLLCTVLHLDSFGNIVLNATNAFFGARFRPGERLTVESTSGRWEARFATTYSDVGQGELAVLQGSQGYIELAAREDSAGKLTGSKVLDELRIVATS